jgi:hypothetical protein
MTPPAACFYWPGSVPSEYVFAGPRISPAILNRSSNHRNQIVRQPPPSWRPSRVTGPTASLAKNSRRNITNSDGKKVASFTSEARTACVLSRCVRCLKCSLPTECAACVRYLRSLLGSKSIAGSLGTFALFRWHRPKKNRRVGRTCSTHVRPRRLFIAFPLVSRIETDMHIPVSIYVLLGAT